MSTGANSYGTAADVAALTPRFTATGSYSTSTKPTLAQVEGWIDQVSATLNILLAEERFSVPVTQADCVLSLKSFVCTQVADLANYANSAGRFFQNQQFQTGPWQAIQKEAAEFIGKHAAGFENLGATRTRPGLVGLDANLTDNSGADIVPIFSRKQFRTTNTDWDPAE